MKGAFTHFMTGLIDYAGLFPPAGLDLATALAEYADYLAGENAWMLGRCVIPATQLSRVGLHPGFRYSVIVSPAVAEEELDQMSNFSKSHGRVEMVEMRFAETDNSPEHCADHLLHLKSKLNRAGLQDIQLFVEAESGAPVAALAAALSTFNTNRDGGKVIANAGYKLRCGGVDKEAFPTADQVAEAIAVCNRHDVPMKFTAGLHQPLCNQAHEFEVMEHGFLNIFAAALLCWGGSLATGQIAKCLRDGIADHFRFTEEAFSWQDHTISAAEIRRLRQHRLTGFGSCSFAEPVAGLHSLGFLGHPGA